MVGIKPGAGGYVSKYANHCAKLPPMVRPSIILTICGLFFHDNFFYMTFPFGAVSAKLTLLKPFLVFLFDLY